jgi:hypothetical protein
LSLTENFRNIRGTGQDSFQDLDDLGFIYMPFFTIESAFHCSISGEDDASILIAALFFESENLDKKLPLHSDSLSRVSKLLNVQTHERTRKDPTHCQAVIPVRDVINIDAEHNRPNPDKTGT